MKLNKAALLLGTWMGARMLYADAISVDAMVQCDDVVATNSCFVVNSFASNYYENNIPATSDPTTGSIGGSVNTFFVPNGPDGPVSSMITMTLSLTTDGPTRPGSLLYSIGITADGSQSSFGGGWFLAGMSRACSFDCNASGLEDFTLGAPFQVSLNGYASSGGNRQSDGAFTGNFMLSMFDEDGVPVAILPYDGDGPFITPEPASVWQFSAGAAALALLLGRRRKLRLRQ